MARDKEPFRKLSPRVWRSQRFKKLSDDGRLAHIFMLTSSHITLCGVGICPVAYGAADLAWDEYRFEKARDEIAQAGLIVLDTETDEYFAPAWFTYNAPVNPSVRTGWQKQLERVESQSVRLFALQELHQCPHSEPEDRPRKASSPSKSTKDADEAFSDYDSKYR